MKLFGIELVDAGQKIEKPKGEEAKMGVAYAPDDPAVKDGKRYATVHIESKEVTAVKGKEVKDRCLMVAIVDVARRVEQETHKEGQKPDKEVSVTLRLVQVGFKPYSGKKAGEMSDEELDKGIREGGYDAEEEHVSRKGKT